MVQPQVVAPFITATGKDVMNSTDASTLANALIRGPSPEDRRRARMDPVLQEFATTGHTKGSIARCRMRGTIRSGLQKCGEPVLSDHAGEHRHVHERGEFLRTKRPHDRP
ncbi:Uncharacterised protein [Mycobacteroides abscessus subsp. massiliense]|nr:Uncharacterised protein [Mycobacteroides abscessus subsp. massiliense]